MGALRPIIEALLVREQRIRRELEAELAHTDPEYGEDDDGTFGTTFDRFVARHNRFAETYPWYDQVWYRRLRWKLEALDEWPGAAWYRTKRAFGWRSDSTVWHAMHTSDPGRIDWQCPDCDTDGRCHDDDPEHLCTSEVIFDVTEVDRASNGPVICSFCGREAPGT